MDENNVYVARPRVPTHGFANTLSEYDPAKDLLAVWNLCVVAPRSGNKERVYQMTINRGRNQSNRRFAKHLEHWATKKTSMNDDTDWQDPYLWEVPLKLPVAPARCKIYTLISDPRPFHALAFHERDPRFDNGL